MEKKEPVQARNKSARRGVIGGGCWRDTGNQLVFTDHDIAKLHFSEAASDDGGGGAGSCVEHQHLSQHALRNVGIGAGFDVRGIDDGSIGLGTVGQGHGGAVNLVEIAGGVSTQDVEIVSGLGPLVAAEVGIDDEAGTEKIDEVLGAEDVALGGGGELAEGIDGAIHGADSRE